jgi:hypothetical protein
MREKNGIEEKRIKHGQKGRKLFCNEKTKRRRE